MSGEFVTQLSRTHTCGELRAEHEGLEVVLMGWADTRRDHGGLVFVDLRDRYGLVQVVLNPSEEATTSAKDIRNEFVVAVKGRVRLRPEGMNNDKIKTGRIEVEALRCQVLSEAETPPFQIGDPRVSESLRLQYRYLDLRNPQLQDHIISRHETMQVVRRYLSQKDFVEVETPILYKSTPEGARDYLVPSRVHPGQFFALPQSPQTLKQLLMVSGFDRYFQIARCFRDEDLRADRQPEFSQIDIEMSFVDEKDLRNLTEGLVREVWKQVRGQDIEDIPMMTYQEAMNRFGCDKPDLRLPWELVELNEQVQDCGFQVFEEAVSRGDVVKGLAVPAMGDFSRGKLDKLTSLARQMGAKGLVWIKSSSDGELTSPASKFFPGAKLQELYFAAGGVSGGGVLIVADEFGTTCAALSALRLHLGEELSAFDYSKDRFLWVTDFPLLEYDVESKRWMACHHPFTAPKDEDLNKLFSKDERQLSSIRAKAYDFVCNGHELAGGSIRIHNSKVQAALFQALGLSDLEIEEKFGFFVEALRYGTPPHGGIAFGMDRLAMILCQTDAIRDVIAFPKTTKASDLMAHSPSRVDTEQLIELGLRLAPVSKGE